MHILGTASDFCNLKINYVFHTPIRGHLLIKERVLAYTWNIKYNNRIFFSVSKAESSPNISLITPRVGGKNRWWKNCNMGSQLAFWFWVFSLNSNGKVRHHIKFIAARNKTFCFWAQAVAPDISKVFILIFFTNVRLMKFLVRYLALCHVFSAIDGDSGWEVFLGYQLMLVFLKALFLVIHFSYYTSMIFLMMLSVIL